MDSGAGRPPLLTSKVTFTLDRRPHRPPDIGGPQLMLRDADIDSDDPRRARLGPVSLTADRPVDITVNGLVGPGPLTVTATFPSRWSQSPARLTGALQGAARFFLATTLPATRWWPGRCRRRPCRQLHCRPRPARSLDTPTGRPGCPPSGCGSRFLRAACWSACTTPPSGPMPNGRAGRRSTRCCFRWRANHRTR